jgi:hypothetical protein
MNKNRNGQTKVPMDVPLVGLSVVQICSEGHVVTLPKPGIGFYEQTPTGQVFHPYCPVCQAKWTMDSFPGRVLSGSTTPEQAAEAVKAWREEVGLPPLPEHVEGGGDAPQA